MFSRQSNSPYGLLGQNPLNLGPMRTSPFFTLLTLLTLPAVSLSQAAQKHHLGELPSSQQKPVKTVEPTVAPSASPNPNELTIEEKNRRVNEVVEEFYQKGLKALQEGDLEQAEGFFDRALILRPKHKGAQDGIDFIMQSYEDSKVPEEVKEKPVEPRNKPEQEKAELIKKLQLELNQKFSEEDFEEANNIASEILAIDPKNKFAKQKVITLNKHFYADALARAEEREKAEDYKSALDALHVAMGYRKDQNLKAKIKELHEKLAQKEMGRAEELYVKALVASQNGNTDEAIKLCKDALKIDPRNLHAKRMLERLEPKGTP
jgi:tetratricopeptide (TPR) repeat protein